MNKVTLSDAGASSVSSSAVFLSACPCFPLTFLSRRCRLSSLCRIVSHCPLTLSPRTRCSVSLPRFNLTVHPIANVCAAFRDPLQDIVAPLGLVTRTRPFPHGRRPLAARRRPRDHTPPATPTAHRKQPFFQSDVRAHARRVQLRAPPRRHPHVVRDVPHDAPAVRAIRQQRRRSVSRAPTLHDLPHDLVASLTRYKSEYRLGEVCSTFLEKSPVHASPPRISLTMPAANCQPPRPPRTSGEQKRG